MSTVEKKTDTVHPEAKIWKGHSLKKNSWSTGSQKKLNIRFTP